MSKGVKEEELKGGRMYISMERTPILKHVRKSHISGYTENTDK